jgi:hypothetical protein
LYDPVGIRNQEPLVCDGLTIVASSPNEGSYKQYKKNWCDVMFMPCWSKDEITHLAEQKFHEVYSEVASKRFDEIGGIPRFVFAEQLVYDRYRDEVSSAIEKFDINLLFGDGSVEKSLQSTHKLMQIIPRSAEDQSTNYRRYTIDFLTPRLRELTIAELFRKKIDHGYELMTRSSVTVLGASRGVIFEELVWLCLTKEEAETRQWRYWNYTKPDDKKRDQRHKDWQQHKERKKESPNHNVSSIEQSSVRHVS